MTADDIETRFAKAFGRANSPFLTLAKSRAANTSDRAAPLLRGSTIEENASRASGSRRGAPHEGRQTSTQPANSKRPSAPAPVAKAFTQADVDLAVDRGRSMERARVQAVFSAAVARGRERTAADFLSSGTGGALSAKAICEALAAIPTDAERERQQAKARGASISAMWDRVIAREG